MAAERDFVARARAAALKVCRRIEKKLSETEVINSRFSPGPYRRRLFHGCRPVSPLTPISCHGVSSCHPGRPDVRYQPSRWFLLVGESNSAHGLVPCWMQVATWLRRLGSPRREGWVKGSARIRHGLAFSWHELGTMSRTWIHRIDRTQDARNYFKLRDYIEPPVDLAVVRATRSFSLTTVSRPISHAVEQVS